jgi:hypothetical protein
MPVQLPRKQRNTAQITSFFNYYFGSLLVGLLSVFSPFIWLRNAAIISYIMSQLTLHVQMANF